MDTKGSQNILVSNLTNVPIAEDGIIYIAIKGSLHATDCSVFGLGQEEIKAIIKKFPGSGSNVVNGVTIKANVLQAINALCQLGYKVVCTTGKLKSLGLFKEKFNLLNLYLSLRKPIYC